MRFHILLLIGVFISLCLFSSLIDADRNSLFCKIRSVGLEYAKSLQPFRSTNVWTEIADALNGAADTANCHVSPSVGDNKNLNNNNNRESRVLSYPLPTPSSSSHIVFITADPDTPFVADGTESRPFSSIESAFEIIRSRRLNGEWKSTNHVHLILRKGIHRLSNTLTLTSADSHLTLQSYPDEEAIISGAIELKKLEWKQLNPPYREEYEAMNGGYLQDGFDIAPPATLSLKDALAYCSSLELCRGVSRAWNEDVSLTYFKYYVFWAPSSSNISHIKNVGYTPSAKQLFFVANISEIDLKGSAIESLRVNGDRMIRARYPNVPRVELIGAMQLIANSWTAQSDSPKANYTFNPSYPLRNDTSGDWFSTFRIGVGGACADRFIPQASYWCSDNSQGGGPGPYEAPVGMVTQLPHSPYFITKDIDRINIHTWRADRWFSWVFAVDKADYSNDKVTLSFSRSRGGNQGSRGGNAGQEFFIDNVLDELDQPAEFYHDTSSGLLYLWFNSTNPYEASVEAAIHQRLIQSIGTKQNPVRDINLLGLTFVDSAPTFLEPHGTPSGGDWGLSRTGALFFEGTENLNIEGCLFKNLDGNAVFLSGYTRGAKITRNEFFQIGETCIASWGYTDGSPVPGMGFDGTAGNQPRGSIISYNLIHEIGLWTKQNSAMFQSESFYNIYEGNIAYNGPRAGINFNDGMGGGSSVLRNVLFNFCRESSDHASFNSWNRQVYLVEDPITGKPTTAKLNDTIAYNWILANYQSSMAVDNDDGSAYYDTHHNVMISSSDGASYGGFSLKSDFGGHDNFHHDNLDLFWGRGFSIDAALPSHADGYYNNYLYLASDGPYGDAQDCYGSSSNGKTIVFNNTVWSPTGAIQECGMTLKQWQQLSPNNDPGTVGLPHPNDDVVIAIAKQILNL